MDPDEIPFPDNPKWNPKALRQFARFLVRRRGGQIEDNPDDAGNVAREYRYALGKLLALGLVERTPGQGRRSVFRVRP